ncbi:hypothetical protein [Curtobacterium sp. MCBD17_003]|uniref:hypothetical protein n=1 Tax=Curtobacterium sp. MCBD17_003 TaxID=2175667 RepID=UPI000DAAA507|nr:hypothetical protein [Curtobacterium sp. MCBD17_003]WIE54011.1 hypothetical protein DEI88_012915 [Curtobacterium sp. MCBD17_003]
MRTVQSFLTETVPRVVEPVLDAMLTPDERALVHVQLERRETWTRRLPAMPATPSDGEPVHIGAGFVPDREAVPPRPAPVRSDSRLGGNDYVLAMSVPGHGVGVPLVEDESDAQFAWRFANDVQDFVAESPFAWGQRRPLPDWVHDPWA